MSGRLIKITMKHIVKPLSLAENEPKRQVNDRATALSIFVEYKLFKGCNVQLE